MQGIPLFYGLIDNAGVKCIKNIVRIQHSDTPHSYGRLIKCTKALCDRVNGPDSQQIKKHINIFISVVDCSLYFYQKP
jgi:hypothetical protein